MIESRPPRRTRRTPSPRLVSLAAVLAAGALGVAACGTGLSVESNSAQDADGGRTLMESITAATLGGTNKATTASGEKADVAPKTARPDAPAQLMVQSVRVGAHEGFDRIVFDLVGDGTPGWFVDYTTAPRQQGSGNPVNFQGSMALDVNIDGTAYPFEVGQEDPQIGTVAGAGNVTQVISVGTFEGRSQFIVGLKEKLPYSVEVLQDPHRLVLDVRHH